MQHEFEEKYHSIEKNHFWFRSRRHIILKYLENLPRNAKILDIGCSSGILLKEIENIGFDKRNLFGIDISPKAIEKCKQNGLLNSYVVDAHKIELKHEFDVIIASDSLEHLKDDHKALKNWNSLLRNDGVLIVFVPAYMFLWSKHDEVNMHYRRYTKSGLTTKLRSNNFIINKSSYWNFILFVPLLIFRLIQKIIPTNSSQNSGDLKSLGVFNAILFRIMRFENKILKFINFPFGVSTYCIATKRTTKSPSEQQ